MPFMSSDNVLSAPEFESSEIETISFLAIVPLFSAPKIDRKNK